MDFESYIGRERQLISKLDKERTDNNSYERRADVGNYELAEDEIRLLRSGDYVQTRTDIAMEAVATLDERLAELLRIEDSINARSAEFKKKIAEWDTGFDHRCAGIIDRIDAQLATLEKRNAELHKTIDTAGKDLAATRKATTEEITTISAASTAEVRKISGTATAEIEKLAAELKVTQAEFDASVTEKLKQDKETVERIRYMMKMMSEMVKM